MNAGKYKSTRITRPFVLNGKFYAFDIFDKGYYDLARLYRIQSIGSMFIIRSKAHLKYDVVAGDELAVITYCLVAIVEHDCQLGRTTFNVLRVLSRVLTDKTSIRDLFKGSETIEDTDDDTFRSKEM